MSELTPEDREALAAAKRRSPNGHWIEVAVERIAAAHVARATADAEARAEKAERERDQWKERLWVSVRERAVWMHEKGEHDGRQHPYAYCPMCATADAEARLAEVRELASEWDAARDYLRSRAGGSTHADRATRREANTWDVAARNLRRALAAPTTDADTRRDDAGASRWERG